MAELPNVFPGPINNKINNVQQTYFGNQIDRDENTINNLKLIDKINKIFTSPDFVYKKTIKLATNKSNRMIEKTIIGRKTGYLITNENEFIRIDDIINIED